MSLRSPLLWLRPRRAAAAVGSAGLLEIALPRYPWVGRAAAPVTKSNRARRRVQRRNVATAPACGAVAAGGADPRPGLRLNTQIGLASRTATRRARPARARAVRRRRPLGARPAA